MSLTKGEGVCPYSRNQKLYAEGAVTNTTMLTNQLIEPIFRDHAVSICVGIHAMVSAGRLAIEGNPETHRLPVRARP